MKDKEYILIFVHITYNSANIQCIIGDSWRYRNAVLLHILVEIFTKCKPSHFFEFWPDIIRHYWQLLNKWFWNSCERNGAFRNNPGRITTLFGPRHSWEVYSRQCQECLLEQSCSFWSCIRTNMHSRNQGTIIQLLDCHFQRVTQQENFQKGNCTSWKVPQSNRIQVHSRWNWSFTSLHNHQKRVTPTYFQILSSFLVWSHQISCQVRINCRSQQPKWIIVLKKWRKSYFTFIIGFSSI